MALTTVINNPSSLEYLEPIQAVDREYEIHKIFMEMRISLEIGEKIVAGSLHQRGYFLHKLYETLHFKFPNLLLTSQMMDRIRKTMDFLFQLEIDCLIIEKSYLLLEDLYTKMLWLIDHDVLVYSKLEEMFSCIEGTETKIFNSVFLEYYQLTVSNCILTRSDS